MKIGILFSGQGAQYSGMGRSLYDNCPKAKEIFDMAGDEIKRRCFEGSDEDLKQTEITQPVVYTVSMAAWAAFKDLLETELPAGRVEVAGMAGFSLGEYAAYTASGIIRDFETGLALVKKRGAFMSEAGRYADGSPRGAMAALMGNREAILRSVEAARGDDVFEAVNFNAPNQTVAAGDAAAIERLKIRAKADGVKIIPLNVSTAFHTPIMMPASEELRRFTEDFIFETPNTPLYSNITGRKLMDDKPEDMPVSAWVRDRMSQQVMCPVYWQETIESMAADGICYFIETGPGKTLAKLVKRSSPEASAFNIEDVESLMNTIGELKNAAQ
ncbi:MAG: ACP S-malonyltransferase [Clostridiales Family XIII bacterium]|jgi:[acyl-carrier-protein] S-malonyltransferase|nr:ACP S-malonyltransferase [Clostridiales Family XIII bacterium]